MQNWRLTCEMDPADLNRSCNLSRDPKVGMPEVLRQFQEPRTHQWSCEGARVVRTRFKAPLQQHWHLVPAWERGVYSNEVLTQLLHFRINSIYFTWQFLQDKVTFGEPTPFFLLFKFNISLLNRLDLLHEIDQL